MKNIDTNKKNKNKSKKNKSKKYLCAMCVLIFALLDPVLLCGCAAAREEVTLELAEPESTVSENMTQLSETETAVNTKTDTGIITEPDYQIVFIDTPGIVTSALAKNNVVVDLISKKSVDLEEYFMKVIGGDKNA